MSLLELFESTPFLEKKLGAEVFDEVPQNPGIYRFYDDRGTLLYVGKAKNLRKRLFTYKRAKAGWTSKKESALVSRIDRFEYDVLDSEQEAILEENKWIREHRPEFNYANKHTETYYFVTIRNDQTGLMFGLSMNSSGNIYPGNEKPIYQQLFQGFNADSETRVYGCFKGHRPVRQSLGALLQLIWMAEHKTFSPHFLPVQLSRNLTPLRFHLPIRSGSGTKREELTRLLDNWFLGQTDELIHILVDRIGNFEGPLFAKNYIDETVEQLRTYFQRNLERHRIIRETIPARQSRLIQQHELDDLIAKISYSTTNSASQSTNR